MLVFRAGPTKATKAKTPSKTDASNETDASRRKRKQADATGRKRKQLGASSKTEARQTDASANATGRKV
jgi:hypothetical protein